MQLAPRQLELFRQQQRPSPSAERAVAAASTATTQRVNSEVAEPAVAAPTAAPSRSTRGETIERARLLAQTIAQHLGPSVKVQLKLHDNRSTMMSFRRAPPLLYLRLHHMFLDAPFEVVQAIAEYAGRGVATASQRLDDFIANHQATIRVVPRNESTLKARGRCFDLDALFAELNKAYFEGRISARIGWGRHTSKRRRKSIRLGVYDHRAREIRIHPVLDRPDVPRFFVEFIVYHEMLHQEFPSARDSGRHVHHPKAFRQRERAFAKYEAAMAWEAQHLRELLSR
jgi:hypothetical protein